MSEPLRFAVGPVVRNKDRHAAARKFCAIVMGLMNVRVHLDVADDYDQLAQWVRDKKCDFAWLPPALFVLCAREYETRLLLGGVRGNESEFCGSLFVLSSHPAKTLDDLKGCSVAWVDPMSCSGYLFPRQTVREGGYDPSQFFAREEVLGTHAEVVQAVALGQVDVGATFYHAGGQAEPGWALEVDPSIMRPVTVSAPIPADVIAASASMPRETRQKLKAYLAEVHQTEAGQRLSRRVFGIERFEPVHVVRYQRVAQALKAEQG